MASQYGQDRFVVETLGGMRGGFFLDSGASDGVSANNTLLLETQLGWSGICVEPNDDMFRQLRRNRRCQCVNCCLYDRSGEVEFVERAKTLGGILAEYHPAHLRFAAETFGLAPDMPETVTKPACPVGTVLRRHGAPSVIDYWSLDTEGSELSILRTFPFDEYAVRVLTVEHNWLPMREQVRELLERHRYVFAGTLVIDDCYVMPKLLPPASRGRPHWRSAAWPRRRR